MNTKMMELDLLGRIVADASVRLQEAVSVRYQARRQRKVELHRYADETGEFYDFAVDLGEDRDEALEAAHRNFVEATATVLRERGALRRATTRYRKASEAYGVA